MTDAKGTARLDMTRRIAAPRAKVFAAWTTPELMKQWFAPRPWTFINESCAGKKY